MQNLRIVLVETSHPGNIGAAARAMKTMGLSKLTLVRPKTFPCAEATARASGADDVLSQAVVCESLQEAIRDCGFVMGTSARLRRLPWPLVGPRECGELLFQKAGNGTEVALVFGREKFGLSNDELDLCHSAVCIPTNPDYSSLNLASAVQVLSYEIRMASGDTELVSDAGNTDKQTPTATSEQLEQLNRHLQDAMIAVGFLNPENPRQLPRRIKRLLAKAGLDHKEVQILRGFLAAVDEKTD